MSDTGAIPEKALRQIKLPVLESTNPSLAESMRACMLMAGLSSANGIQEFVLGNPKAWLGTAYHEVLTQLPGNGGQEKWEVIWENAVQRQYNRAKAHPLDSRFGPPVKWPGYYFMFETVRLRAAEISQRVVVRAGDTQAPPAGHGPQRETTFKACGGKLSGKPDLVLNRKIEDYKTGSIFEENENGQAEIRGGYVRQLQPYSYIVHEALNWWPETAELVPLHGKRISISVNSAECTIAAAEAVALLEKYRSLISDSDPWKLASPSPKTCKWCSFKLLCKSFWQASTTDWAGKLDGEAVEGTLVEAPRKLLGGVAFAIPLDVTAGTVRGAASIAPVRASDDSYVESKPPTAFRFVSLRMREDGSLTTTQRTVHAALCEIPEVTV